MKIKITLKIKLTEEMGHFEVHEVHEVHEVNSYWVVLPFLLEQVLLMVEIMNKKQKLCHDNKLNWGPGNTIF